MGRAHPVGTRRDTIPISPIVEQTRYFPAGAVTIGVEYRLLTDDIVNAHFSYDAKAEEIVAEARRAVGNDNTALEDRGVALHVFDTETGLEYLRFDAFSEDPHYHYISPGEYHFVIGFDEPAHGDCLEWCLRTISSRTAAMLAEVGATALAARVDNAAIAAVLPAVREAALQAVDGGGGPADDLGR